MTWSSRGPKGQRNPYQNEWNDLVDAIRGNKPYNEVPRGVYASLVTSMGRMAAHTGQIIEFKDMLDCDHEMAPGLDKLTMDSPALESRRQGPLSHSATRHCDEEGVLNRTNPAS